MHITHYQVLGLGNKFDKILFEEDISINVETSTDIEIIRQQFKQKHREKYGDKIYIYFTYSRDK